jgi:TolA-binding protein
MKSGTKKRLVAGLTAGAMMLTIASPAMAQVSSPVQINAGNLIAVLNNVNVDITEVRVVNVEDSVNNNRVNVNALQNFLNRNDIDVNIENVLNNNNVEILNNLVTIQGISVDGTTLVIFV